MNLFNTLSIILAVEIVSAAYVQRPLLGSASTCVPKFSQGAVSIVGVGGEITPRSSENPFAWWVEAANAGFIIQSVSSPEKVLTQIVENDKIRISSQERPELGFSPLQLFDITCRECGDELSERKQIGVDCIVRPHGSNSMCVQYTDDAYVVPCEESTNQLFMFMGKRSTAVPRSRVAIGF